ncbi:hypothetical protein ACJJI3_06635 [Microbulbifer sp. ZKSA004]|uniref:hypothetical protein n=1 Tax=Microbulbifer sp. ZKSA004 TaxID=3243389 RepID=UPI00403A48BC
MNSLPSSATSLGLKTFGQSGSGRSIVANDQLHHMLEGFQELSRIPSSEGYHALALTNAVNGLRGGAVPVNSYLKNGSATRRCIVGDGFEIEYELINYYGGPQTDVVILDIRLLGREAEKGKRAALWEVEWESGDSGGSWARKEEPAKFLRTNGAVAGKKDSPLKIGINGYCKGLDHAAEILPSHITRGDAIALEKLQDKGYTIFYVPQDGVTKAGWRFVKNLRTGTTAKDMEAARILAGHMKEAHDKGLYVEWTSHRGGSKVITKAMELLALKQVNVDEKQKIFLSDATSSHYVADNLRRKVGMNTKDSTWYKATPGVAQIVGGSELGLGKVAMEVGELCKSRTREAFANKLVDAFDSAVKLYKGADATVVTFATVAATSGLSFAGAKALFGILAAATANTTLASIPSLNEKYHSGSTIPLKQLLQKGLVKK